MHENFKSKQISLYDTFDFIEFATFCDPVDVDLYLATIKDSRWHGPYKDDDAAYYYFPAINSSGDNQYFVMLSVDLETPEAFSVQLDYLKNSYPIASYHNFYF